jgi:hypothetical protein
MIEVIKGFYKHSTKLSYSIGEKVEFDVKTENRLIKEGLGKKVIETKKKVKK